MKRKIKVLFDVEQLALDGLKGTGLVRVCDELLTRLIKSEKIDIYPILTSSRGDFLAYLKAKGLDKKLKDKIVYLPHLKDTTKDVTVSNKIESFISRLFFKRKYKKILSNYDAYFSPFSPISPLIYQTKLKTYLIIHDIIPIKFPDGCSKKFIKRFTNWMKKANATEYFFVSNFTKNDFLSFRPEEKTKPLHIMHLGANQSFSPVKDKKILKAVKEKYHIQTDKYFLALSEFSERKNFVHLLKSFIAFLEKTKKEDISLVLVGRRRKGFENILSNVPNSLKYQDKIIQTGFADHEDLPPLYSGATSFVYPSLYEGFGLPVLEAMQSGTPVIVSDNSSLPEVGADAVMYITGLDEGETTNALEKIYTDKALQKTLSQKGIQRAKNFNWDTASQLVESVLTKE